MYICMCMFRDRIQDRFSCLGVFVESTGVLYCHGFRLMDTFLLLLVFPPNDFVKLIFSLSHSLGT